MKSERPVASISGSREWRWNRSQAVQRSRDGSRDPPGRCQSAGGRKSRPEREIPPESELADLEAELERKERRLQEIIEHYERLLAEKNRQLAKRSPPTPNERKTTAISKIVRYLPVR
jgi:TATA-binding protein-associated factor Taf7